MTDAANYDVNRPGGVWLLADIKRQTDRVSGNGSASLWDIGDGVLCLEFHTEMNSIDAGIMSMLDTAIKTVPSGGYKALVIHNEGGNFSVCANIGLALLTAQISGSPEIR